MVPACWQLAIDHIVRRQSGPRFPGRFATPSGSPCRARPQKKVTHYPVTQVVSTNKHRGHNHSSSDSQYGQRSTLTSFVQGRIIEIPENRGKVLYKVEFADLSTIPQWFDADKVLPN